MHISEYSISECTLEQIFIQFARQQEEEQVRARACRLRPARSAALCRADSPTRARSQGAVAGITDADLASPAAGGFHAVEIAPPSPGASPVRALPDSAQALVPTCLLATADAHTRSAGHRAYTPLMSTVSAHIQSCLISVLPLLCENLLVRV